MSDAERFDISLGTIESVWLRVCIVVDDERFQVRASSVLDDPLFELAEAADALAGTGAARSEVQLWLEPATLNILFASAPASNVVRVSIRASGFIRDEQSVPLEDYVLDRVTVAAALVSALRDVQRQFDGEAPLRGWGYFPAPTLRAALFKLEGHDPL